MKSISVLFLLFFAMASFASAEPAGVVNFKYTQSGESVEGSVISNNDLSKLTFTTTSGGEEQSFSIQRQGGKWAFKTDSRFVFEVDQVLDKNGKLKSLSLWAKDTNGSYEYRIKFIVGYTVDSTILVVKGEGPDFKINGSITLDSKAKSMFAELVTRINESDTEFTTEKDIVCGSQNCKGRFKSDDRNLTVEFTDSGNLRFEELMKDPATYLVVHGLDMFFLFRD